MSMEDDIAQIEAMRGAALKERWRWVRRKPPPEASVRFLRASLVYALQAELYVDLAPKTKRRLQRLGTRLARDPAAPVTREISLTPGTRLIREWRGDRHVVEVLTKGFAWRGEVYSSLSQIARTITGARWSGPRFFGLTGRRKT